MIPLNEGVGTETHPGHVKYAALSLPTYPHGGAALYINRNIPHSRIDTLALAHGEYKRVAVEVKLWKSTVGSIYVRQKRWRCFRVLWRTYT